MNNFNPISQEQFEQIERYLDGSMDASETLEFNTRIQQDPVLEALVEEMRDTVLGIESGALRANFDVFHQEMDGVRMLDSSKKKSNYWLLGMVATVVIIFGITWFINSESPSEKLYAKYYTPDPGLPTTMSSNDNFEFYDAMVNYKREEYTEAIEKWEAILSYKPTNDTLNYFLGVAYLADGNTDKATTYLKQASAIENSYFKEDALFYAALAEVKKGNMDTAKNLLEHCKTTQCSSLYKAL